MKLRFIVPLALAASAAAIGLAPIASADPGGSQGPSGGNQPHQACTSAVGTVCESPGNTQINDAPPPVGFYPYGGSALLL